jgi:hypothetical protein
VPSTADIDPGISTLRRGAICMATILEITTWESGVLDNERGHYAAVARGQSDTKRANFPFSKLRFGEIGGESGSMRAETTIQGNGIYARNEHKIKRPILESPKFQLDHIHGPRND